MLPVIATTARGNYPGGMLRQELLDAIKAEPRNDELRLMAAAEYEQRGQPERAEFIRTQLAIARLPLGLDDPEWFSLTRASTQMLREYEGLWLADDELSERRSAAFRFDRGFVEFVELSISDILHEQLVGVVERAPIQHVDVLSFEGAFNAARTLAVVNQQVGPQLVSLGLGYLDLNDDDMWALAEWNWPQLRWLSLAGNGLTRSGVDRLARQWRQRMRSLEYVDLLGNPFDPLHQLEYDQDVILRWWGEREVLDMERELEQERVPWLHPRLLRGRIRPVDRLAFGRPRYDPAAFDGG
jgi:uncharacterized protein (TIGR02996 family)